jgi:hypothetical protein
MPRIKSFHGLDKHVVITVNISTSSYRAPRLLKVQNLQRLGKHVPKSDFSTALYQAPETLKLCTCKDSTSMS